LLRNMCKCVWELDGGRRRGITKRTKMNRQDAKIAKKVILKVIQHREHRGHRGNRYFSWVLAVQVFLFGQLRVGAGRGRFAARF
jgi:hypothetical protein